MFYWLVFLAILIAFATTHICEASFGTDPSVDTIMASEIAPLIINPRTLHKFTVIMMHGLGDTANGWAPVAQEFARHLPEVKWILPTAPTRPVTLNFGMPCPAWYDIIGLTPTARHDSEGIRKTRAYVHSLLDEERKHIPSTRIFVGGFSQGGAMAIDAAMTYKAELAGVLALSTYLLRTVKEDRKPDGVPCRIFMAHGDEDAVIQLLQATMSCEALRAMANVQVDWHMYPGMAHEASREELDHLLAFLKQRMQENQ